MFRPNHAHLQPGMFDTMRQLADKVCRRLDASWAGTFYREVFCRIEESIFAVLYAHAPSRPNMPVNVLVGLEAIKAGKGWSDEELYDAFLFNLQVRYALGLWDLANGNFELRTLYNFRRRLSQYMQETGENLLEHVFAQVTDEQLAAMGLKTGQQRMDSTLVASNIRQMSRLQLLVEVLQRVWRMLDESDQAGYAELFAPYREGSAGQYCYRVKGDEVPGHLEAMGRLMQRLVVELAADYNDHPAYRVLQRVFEEHFVVEVAGDSAGEPGPVGVKPGRELSARSLQSPDDWEATFRAKNGQGHRGYVANVAETCDPENPMQLITQVQVAPNVTDDEQLLVEGLADLKERTDLDTLWTDGGYNGPEAEAVLREQQVTHIPTAIRGARPASGGLGLDAFSWETDHRGVPSSLTCPGGQQVPVGPGRKAGRHLAHFDQMVCEGCLLLGQCPTRRRKRRALRVLRLTTRQAQVAQLRQRTAKARGPGNLRAAAESTVRSLKHPFGGQAGKLPVRGQERVAMMLMGSAFMVNLGRIWRYQRELMQKQSPERRTSSPLASFLTRWWQRLETLIRRWRAHLFSALAFTPAKA